jgi:hypothetical protein
MNMLIAHVLEEICRPSDSQHVLQGLVRLVFVLKIDKSFNIIAMLIV